MSIEEIKIKYLCKAQIGTKIDNWKNNSFSGTAADHGDTKVFFFVALRFAGIPDHHIG
jgi:hypothetical protein